jgi:hypothetical protein
MKTYLDLCNAASDDRKLLLSPLCDSTEHGYTHVACLLGSINRGGSLGSRFIKAMATFTGSAPLIVSLRRISKNVHVTGLDIISVTASLDTLCHGYLEGAAKNVFDSVLQLSSYFCEEAPEQTENLPIAEIPTDTLSSEPARLHFQTVLSREKLHLWSLMPAHHSRKKK